MPKDETDAVEVSGVPGEPKPNQLLFMSPSASAAAGGRAAGSRNKAPGNRFNRPTEEDLELYEQQAEELEQVIAEDPVVKNSAGKDSLVLLSTLKAEVAREAAVLAYQRTRLQRQNKDVTSVSRNRIDALKKIADIEMEMRKIGFDQIDVHSEKLQRVFKLWIDLIKEAAIDTLDEKAADLFFNKLTSVMEGWEEQAEELVQ